MEINFTPLEFVPSAWLGATRDPLAHRHLNAENETVGIFGREGTRFRWPARCSQLDRTLNVNREDSDTRRGRVGRTRSDLRASQTARGVQLGSHSFMLSCNT